MKKLTEILTPEEAAFVTLVYKCPGCKLNGGEAWSNEGESLWGKPEELGLIKTVGSYKWVPTDELILGVKDNQ